MNPKQDTRFLSMSQRFTLETKEIGLIESTVSILLFSLVTKSLISLRFSCGIIFFIWPWRS